MWWCETLDDCTAVRVLKPWGPVPPPPEGRTWSGLMREALKLARQGAQQGEVPVGAVLVDDNGRIVGAAHNETENLHDPTAHAEILALRRAAAVIRNHRLEGCVMVVTLEPCLMCTGALREARVSGVVYGAADSRAGAVSSCLDGLDYALAGPAPWHMGGIEAESCAALLRTFFTARR